MCELQQFVGQIITHLDYDIFLVKRKIVLLPRYIGKSFSPLSSLTKGTQNTQPQINRMTGHKKNMHMLFFGAPAAAGIQ
jgi:hypothetical protein